MTKFKIIKIIYMVLFAISVKKVVRRLFQMDKKITCHTVMEILIYQRT